MPPRAPLLPLSEALARVLDGVAPLPPETLKLPALLGRFLAHDVVARRTVPGSATSAVDGYAIREEDAAIGSSLAVVGVAPPGRLPFEGPGSGEAVRILTGGAIPRAADRVVMQEGVERTECDGVSRVTLRQASSAGDHVRARGEDARGGERLLAAGTALGLGALGLLAAQGLEEAMVHRAPRVACFSTGDELIPWDAPVDPADPRPVDTNGLTLALALRHAGAVPVPLGGRPDAPEAIADAFREGRDAGGVDAFVTSGGASVGDRDHLRAVLEGLGADILFHGVAIRPGKPVLVAQWEGRRVFALPGNPTSALVTFELFVRPYLRRLLGDPAPLPGPVPGRLAVPYAKPAGLTHLVRARVEARDGALWGMPLTSQTSGALVSSAGATHLIVVPSAVTHTGTGDPVELWPVCTPV